MVKKKITRRKATPGRRRRTSTNCTTTSKAMPVRRRRTTVKKGGMLSELWNANTATAGAKSALSGAVGGAAAGMVGKFLSGTVTDPKKMALYQIVGGFGVATLLKLPNVGAGMAGVGMFQLMQNSNMLADNFDYFTDPIESLPMVLNDGD